MAAVAASGNQTLAAERAKVSRSWVRLHATGDQAFRAELDAALATARAAIDRRGAGGEGVKPPAGWGGQAGEELVVRGGNGRRAQIARARPRQWTPRAEARFLGALSACCNVKAACAAVGLSPASAYNHYRRWPRFAALWDAALESGYVRIETALVEHAGNMFSPREIAPDCAMPPMTVAEAIQLLRLHHARLIGVGKRPGAERRPPDLARVRASILRKLERFEQAERRRPPAPGADERMIARGARVVAAATQRDGGERD